MPHAVLKLYPGVNTTETPALNENSGVSQSQLVRWFPDPLLGGILQKLGGWTRFFPTAFPAIIRALWAWEDLSDRKHLGVGTQKIGEVSELSVITAGSKTVITPTQSVSTLTNPIIVATSGSASLRITDFIVPGITSLNSVYIPTQFSVQDVVIFGLYPCDPDGFSNADEYTIQAHDLLGLISLATSGVSGATLPTFTTTAGSNIVTVAFLSQNYPVGADFPILKEVDVGGLALLGDYVVQTVIDGAHFTIIAGAAATSSDTQTLGGGSITFIYNGSGTTPPSATAVGTDDWTLDNFGEDLVVCPASTVETDFFGGVQYQPIYLWNPNQATATVIPQAPPVNDGIFVAMPQRQIIAWGSTETGVQDPMLVSWCDVNNPNQWIPLVTNQAGNDRIPKGSRIVGGVQGPQQGLIWTDIDVWAMQYVGPPYVYSFNEIGSGCGLIGRKAAGFLFGIGYWMGPSQFFSLSANGVQPIPCSVWDVVYQDLDQNNLQKIRFAPNSRFGEVAWYYPSVTGGTGEVDSYVKLNVLLGVWDYGKLSRTAWVDQSVLGPPIGADPSTLLLYQHETSNDADGAAMVSYFQTGYFALAEGDFKTFVDLVWPDAKWGQVSQAKTATLMISFYVVDYPGDTPQVFGPYSVTQATEYFNTRLRGRLVSIRVGSSDLGSFWRLGALRYRYAADGKF